MSRRFTGGIISKTTTIPSSSAANGIWTLDQQMIYNKQGVWPDPISGVYADLLILPVSSSAASPTNIAVYNRNTNTLVSNFAASGLTNSCRIARIGNFIISMDYTGNWYTYNMNTGVLVDSGSGDGNSGDLVKISNTVWGRYYKSSSTLYAKTFSMNATTGVSTQIANNSIAAMGDTNNGYNQQQAAHMITINSLGIMIGTTTRISGTALYSYPSGTNTWYGEIIWGTDGSVSVANSTVSTDNFSRPTVATGANGNSMLTSMDGAQVRYNTVGTLGAQTTDYWTPSVNGRAGVGIVGTNYYIAPEGTTSLSIKKMGSGLTPTTVRTISNSGYGILQMAKGGAVASWGNDGSNAYYSVYDGSSWATDVSLNAALGSYKYINYNGTVVKVYNF